MNLGIWLCQLRQPKGYIDWSILDPCWCCEQFAGNAFDIVTYHGLFWAQVLPWLLSWWSHWEGSQVVCLIYGHGAPSCAWNNSWTPSVRSWSSTSSGTLATGPGYVWHNPCWMQGWQVLPQRYETLLRVVVPVHSGRSTKGRIPTKDQVPRLEFRQFVFFNTWVPVLKCVA